MILPASVPRYGLVGIAWGIYASDGHYLIGIGISVVLDPMMTLVALQRITYR